MKRFLVYTLAAFVLFSCDTTTEEDDVKKDEPKEIVGVQTLFQEDVFTDKRHLDLLKELSICSEFQKDTSNYMEPACSPRFFRVL